MESRERKPVLVHLMVKEAFKLLRASVPSLIDLRQSIESSDLKVLADPTELHQLIMNLCTNAVHAIGENKGMITVGLKQIVLPSESADEEDKIRCVLTVTDDGCGIEDDIKSRIMDPFFTTKPKGRGTGLGLSVVHGVVKSLGGTLSVESKPQQGSTFTISLPTVIAEEIHAEPEKLALPSGHESILYVDDEVGVSSFAKNLLHRLGYDVVVRNNGHAAFETYQQNPDRFDLIITDLTMPKMTGLQLAKNVLEINPHMPIILCTGSISQDREGSAKDVGIEHVIKKPFDAQVLARSIRTALD